jgi:uncharacterized protein YggE
MSVRRALFAMAVLASISIGAFRSAAAQVTVNTERPEVRTVATAVRHVPPNLAVLRLNIAGDGRTVKDAGRRLAQGADSLRRTLMSLGVPRDSLLTSSDWYWWGNRIEPIVKNGKFVQLTKIDSAGRTSYYIQDTTFRVHDAIEVRISKLSTIGAIIDSALAHGVSDISTVQFQATELDAPREQALREATANARRQAEAIAASSGMRLGPVISFSTYADASRYGDFGEMGLQASAGGSSDGAGTQVIPRSLPVSMTVYGRWELLPKP